MRTLSEGQLIKLAGQTDPHGRPVEVEIEIVSCAGMVEPEIGMMVALISLLPSVDLGPDAMGFLADTDTDGGHNAMVVSRCTHGQGLKDHLSRERFPGQHEFTLYSVRVWVRPSAGGHPVVVEERPQDAPRGRN